MASRALDQLHERIIGCNACPRLRKHCLATSETKRRAYLSEKYWGKPIPGFGDPKARLVIVGLAPAAHGANRTGRIFTGDRSGDWLYRALFRAGFANRPESVSVNDGLRLKDAYITCAVRCAPPQNRPTPAEIRRCNGFLANELTILANARVWVALGQIAYHALWPKLADSATQQLRPRFGHAVGIPLGKDRWLLLSYHPSQQNTFTGRLTEPMFDRVFSEARRLMGNR